MKNTILESYLHNIQEGWKSKAAIATLAGTTALGGYALYKQRKMFLDRKFRECTLNCDHLRKYTGGYDLCMHRCKKEYRTRLKQTKLKLGEK